MASASEDQADGDPRAGPVVVCRPVGPFRHPLLPVAVAMMLGIALHDLLPTRPDLLLLAAASLAIGTLLRAVPVFVEHIVLLLAVTCLGVTLGQTARFCFPEDEIALYTGLQPRLATVEVELDSDPQLIVASDLGRPRPPKQAVMAYVVAVETWAGRSEAGGSLLLQINQPHPNLRAGQRLRLFGRLDRPGQSVNPGQFDYAAHYRGDRVMTSLHVDGPGNVQILADNRPPTLARIRGFVRDRLQSGFAARDALQAALLRAMLLGDHDPAISDIRDEFRRSGTSHYLAISGLHVAVVGGVVTGLLRLLRFRPRTTWLAGGIVVLAYGLVTLPSVPVIRAVILFTALAAGMIGGRQGQGLNLLATAAVVVLAVFPLDLFRPGFQLSFGVVLGLMLLTPPLMRNLGYRPDGEAAIMRLQRDGTIIRTSRWLDRRLARATVAGVVAWLVAVPLVAQHFSQFNTWAVPGSLAAAPLVFLSLVGGVLKVILSTLAPQADALWAWLATQPVSAMQAIVGFFASLPGAQSPVPPPGPIGLGLWYGGLLLAVTPWPTPTLRWATRATAGSACLVVVVLPLAGGLWSRIGAGPSASHDGALTLTLLAVGDGQCAVVTTPDGRCVIFDAGSMSLSDPVGRCISPFLRQARVTHVDRLFLSHANADHYNAAGELMTFYGVEQILVGSSFTSDARPQTAGLVMLDAMRQSGNAPQILSLGETVPLDAQAHVDVLWPPMDAPDDLKANDLSLVLRLTSAGRRVLLAGDVQGDAMAELLRLHHRGEIDLSADVLIAPHHGSRESETDDFIAAVDAKWILASNGRNLSMKQIAFERELGARPLWRTSDYGALTVRVTSDGQMTLTPFITTRRRGLTVSH